MEIPFFCRMTLRNLAHFHAVGYFMIADAGGPESFLEKNPFTFEVLYNETNQLMGMFESRLGTACDLLANSDEAGGKEALEKLSKYQGILAGLICGLATRDHLLHVVSPANILYALNLLKQFRNLVSMVTVKAKCKLLWTEMLYHELMVQQQPILLSLAWVF